MLQSHAKISDQVTKDAKSMFTFEKWPLVAKLKFKMAEFCKVFHILNFSLEFTYAYFFYTDTVATAVNR